MSAPHRGKSPLRPSGFTIIEVMIAMAIFMMVVAAMYATWTAVLRSAKAGLQAAANVQRGRIALRTLQDALLTAVNYPDNVKYYTFVAKSEGDFADIEFSARLPSSFPGVGRYGGSLLRRVRFTVEPGKASNNELVMYEKPFLLPPDNDFSPYRLVLSHDVSLFMVEFFDSAKREYSPDWRQTNALPKLVRVAVGLGRQSSGNGPQDLVSTSIAIPATAIGRETQTPRIK